MRIQRKFYHVEDVRMVRLNKDSDQIGRSHEGVDTMRVHLDAYYNGDYCRNTADWQHMGDVDCPTRSIRYVKFPLVVMEKGALVLNNAPYERLRWRKSLIKNTFFVWLKYLE